MRRTRILIVTVFLTLTGLSAALVAITSGRQARSQGASSPPPALGRIYGVPRAAATVLQDIKAKDTDQLAVSEEDGRFLRVLAARGARKALEIGGASGYSAIWIGLGLRESGGRLVSIEYDPGRAREATANVARAGLSDIVRVIPGDAFQEIPKLTGTFDFVFLDAWKPDYRKFFDLTFPRLDKGGVFLAHNVVNKKREMTDFLTRITGSADVWTTIVTPSGEGMSITYKLR